MDAFEIVLPRVHEVEYDLTHHGDSFFIRTNDDAKTFRVVHAPVGDPSRPTGRISSPKRDRRHRGRGASRSETIW